MIFARDTHYSEVSPGAAPGFFVKGAPLHELGLTQNIVELAIRHAEREQAQRVVSITVEIGALSGVVAEAVAFAFDVCSRGTLAEGARLDIRPIQGRGQCLDCSRQAEIKTLTHVCPHCGSLALETIQGQEMKFIEMEID